jgi:hypothetical protein
MTRLPLALLLAAVLALSGCSNDSNTPRTKVASRDAVNPCTLAWDDQQIATTFVPANAAMKPAKLDGDLAAGLAADGVCFDVRYEMYTKGWKVVRSRISATQGGVGYSQTVPDRVYRAQFDDKGAPTKPLPGLYVPLRGCVDVTASVDLTGPHGVRGSYTATSTYGRNCAKYTGGPSSGS